MVDELTIAKPTVVGLDITFPEPAEERWVPQWGHDAAATTQPATQPTTKPID